MRILARTLLLLVFIQAGGFLLMNSLVHFGHHYAVLKEKKYLQHFSFTVEELSKLKIEDHREFLLGGTWYDVEKCEIINGRFEIEAYADKKENELKEGFKKGENSHQNASQIPVIKSIDGKCLVVYSAEIIEISASLRVPQHILFCEKIFSEVVSPPPESV